MCFNLFFGEKGIFFELFAEVEKTIPVSFVKQKRGDTRGFLLFRREKPQKCGLPPSHPLTTGDILFSPAKMQSSPPG